MLSVMVTLIVTLDCSGVRVHITLGPKPGSTPQGGGKGLRRGQHCLMGMHAANRLAFRQAM